MARDDLIQEAREFFGKEWGEGSAGSIITRLADALERVEKERDEANAAWLKAKNESSRLLGRRQQDEGTIRFLGLERDRLRGENERLREALEYLASWDPIKATVLGCEDWRHIASAALRGEEA